jgi:hypothetical protein
MVLLAGLVVPQFLRNRRHDLDYCCGSKFLWKGLSASDFGGAALGALLALGPFGLYWWLRRRDIRRANTRLEAINPLKLTFDMTGLNTTEKNGSRNFTPWSQFDGFREGKTVLLLRESGSKKYRLIPRETDPPGDADKLVSTIRARLPEIH